MIGNDIVDLSVAKTESNWKRKGYLEKVFTLDEQNQILASKNAELMLWLFWSMKEAAYKIIHRNNKIRFYNPKKIHTEITGKTDTVYCGNALYNDQVYITKSIVANNYIHTIATTTKEELDTVIAIIEDKQSYSIQSLITILFKQTNLLLHKDKNLIPNLKNTKTGEKFPVSISHHGQFISLASFNTISML